MRHRLGMLDWLFFGFAVGGVGCWVVGFGFLQIRQAGADATLMWPLRKYYLKKVTDKAMQPSVTWKYLKFEMCKRFETAQAKYASPAGKLVGETLTGAADLVGLKVPLCDPVAACRENVMQRCLQYELMAFCSLVCMGLSLLGAIFWVAGAAMLLFSCKPKVRFSCAFICIFGLLMFVGSFVFYDLYFGKMASKLQAGMVWPAAPLYGPGWWAALFGAASMGTAITMMILSAFFAKAAELVDGAMDMVTAPGAPPPGGMPDGGMPVAY